MQTYRFWLVVLSDQAGRDKFDLATPLAMKLGLSWRGKASVSLPAGLQLWMPEVTDQIVSFADPRILLEIPHLARGGLGPAL